MAIKKITKDGYGQIELNNVAFRRDGRIEAQCALNTTDFTKTAPAENGMILAVDKVAREIKLKTSTDSFPLAINYSAEHMYAEGEVGLKDFYLVPDTFYPRLGYLSVGDTFTTNTVSFDETDYADEATLKTALGSATLKTAPVYATSSTNGYIQIAKTKPESGTILAVCEATDMPDGQFGIKFQVIA